MTPVLLSPSRARRIILHAAGLSGRAQFGKGKEAVHRFIEHLGFLQIDTNYVVERAHHHSIWSRVPDYQPDWLLELQDEGKIFEFWTFASGYIPIEDFRYSFPIKKALAARRKTITQKEINLMNRILDRISREGPLMARDFENDRVTKSTGWWDWRPSKIALERLHFDGRLVTMRRKDFQKRYELPANVIPGDVDQRDPGPEEFARHVILGSLRAWGIGHLKDVGYRARYVKDNAVKTELKKLVEEGFVVEVQVQGLSPRPGKTSAGPFFMLADYLKTKISSSNDVFILSPFDTLNVLRHRLKYFFDFDYQVECFVPEKKRKYGYFALPVLAGERFIARMDAKADRYAQTLIINNLHFEKTSLPHATLKKLARTIRDFALFNSCTRIDLLKVNDKEAMTALHAELKDVLSLQAMPRRTAIKRKITRR